jgi:hypothetical protein
MGKPWTERSAAVCPLTWALCAYALSSPGRDDPIAQPSDVWLRF